MREILFRGKQEYKNKEWVFGSLHSEYGETDKNGQCKIDYRILGMRGECDYVLSETVGQYTGLTDKDGKKIFEGDIVNCYTFTGMNDYRRGVVHWNEMFCGWYGKESCSLLCGLSEIYEVIGNIHDNPELLENP